MALDGGTVTQFVTGTNTGGTEYTVYENKPETCKHCGRCPHCGRGPQDAIPYPVYPWSTPMYPQPVWVIDTKGITYS